MFTSQEKMQQDKNHSTSLPFTQNLQDDKFPISFIKNKPEADSQRNLQEIANNSPRVRQLNIFQEMANNSPRVMQLAAFQKIANNSPRVLQLSTFQEMANKSPRIVQLNTLQQTVDNVAGQEHSIIQKKENNTGLPEHIKSGIETLSGLSAADVKVHYNSDKPARYNAFAFTQGTEIHLAPGQEKHLGHEAWHTVQQKQNRVQPMIQLADSFINDDPQLEHESDVMGAKAAAQSYQEVNLKSHSLTDRDIPGLNSRTIQRVVTVKKKNPLNPPDSYDESKLVALIKILKGCGYVVNDEGDRLLDFMLRQRETYQFASYNELVHAINAQTLLNKLGERSPDDKIRAIEKVEIHEQAGALASAFTFSQKHNLMFFVRPEDVLRWGGPNLISQSLQQRGDMIHILPALKLGNLKVVLCWENSRALTSDAFAITEYYLPMRENVCLYAGNMQEIRAPRSLTYATEVLKQSSMSDPMGTRHQIQEITTGRITRADRLEYERWCIVNGFRRSFKNKYVIVSHRDTGHNVPDGRQPSHPELDTGEVGFAQLMQIVHRAGFIPVPMGTPRDHRLLSLRPNMIKYWDSLKGFTFVGRTKRQVEYGLIRYLAEEYGVRLLAMRSGNTDAMAFSGMETIFIDLASEGAEQGELDRAHLGTEAHNRSWRRAALLETILPGIFHQVFFKHPRPEEGGEGPWKGRFGGLDPLRIRFAVNQFFKKQSDGITVITERAFNSPLLPEQRETFDRAREARKLNEKKGQRYESFIQFATTVEDDHVRLIRSVPQAINRMDITLKRIETQLKIMDADLQRQRLILFQMKLDLIRLQIYLDQLKKRLTQVIEL